jgi:hypothetical protein
MESRLPLASQAAEAVAAGRLRFSCQKSPIGGGPPIDFLLSRTNGFTIFMFLPIFKTIAYSLRNESSEAVLIGNFRNE